MNACHIPKHKYVKLIPNRFALRLPSYVYSSSLTSMMGVRRGDGRGGDGRDQAREQQEQERDCPHGDWRWLHVRGRSNTDRFHPSSPYYSVADLLPHVKTICI